MSAVVTDARGRKIGVRAYDPGVGLDFAEAAGDQSVNAGYYAQALPAFLATDIDGVPLPLPTNRPEIRANVVALGTEGVKAVTEWLVEAGKSKEDIAKN